MSATIGDFVHIHTCDVCETQFKTDSSAYEEYCGPECYYKARGKGALNQLENEHKICAACFRPIKTVHEASQGFKDRKADKVDTALDHGAELTAGPDGEVTLDLTDATNARHTHAEAIIGYQYPTTHTDYLYGNSGKWICECGNVDTHKRQDILAEMDLEATIGHLLCRLDELYAKGAIDRAPDSHVFEQAFAAEALNWELAIGKALYGDTTK